MALPAVEMNRVSQAGRLPVFVERERDLPAAWVAVAVPPLHKHQDTK